MFEIYSNQVIETSKVNAAKPIDSQGSSFFNYIDEAVQSVESQVSLHNEQIESTSNEPVKANLVGSYIAALLDIKHEGSI